MLPSNNIQSIVGATLYGRDKAKLGRIDQVLVDAADGHPTWALLHDGIFGRKNLFVPLDDATWENDDVFVDLAKDDVKDAPHPDADGGLSAAEEQELRAHYAAIAARDAGAAPAESPAPERPDAVRSAPTDGQGTNRDGRADTGNDAQRADRDAQGDSGDDLRPGPDRVVI